MDDAFFGFLYGFWACWVVVILVALVTHVPKDAEYTRALNKVQLACPNAQIANYVKSYPKPFDDIDEAAARTVKKCIDDRP